MGFQQAVRTCFEKYVTFQGRARRSEYWFFFLFNWLAAFALYVVGSVMGGGTILLVLFALAAFLPNLAVAVRRLHDLNASGWWYLLVLVPLGGLALLVWFCFKGTPGDNRFGPDPFGPSVEVFD